VRPSENVRLLFKPLIYLSSAINNSLRGRVGPMAGLQPHVPKIYRYLGTGLGASMWFWV
jgi:hypothetical protein